MTSFLKFKQSRLQSLTETMDNIGGVDSFDINRELFTAPPAAPEQHSIAETFRRSPTKTKTKRTSAGQRLHWRLKKHGGTSKARARTRLRRPATKRRIGILQKWRARRHIPKRKVGRGGRIRGSLMTGMNQISNLMEEVRGIVEGIETTDQQAMIQAYANAAIVAEGLADKFVELSESVIAAIEEGGIPDEELDEAVESAEDFAALAEDFSGVAEESATSAEALFESVSDGTFVEDVNVGNVESHFRGIMESVLDGCEIYSSVVESIDGDDDDSGEDDGDDEEEEASA